jgi:hypothetical protein
MLTPMSPGCVFREQDRSMEPPRANETLHELLLRAVERAAAGQEESAARIEQGRDVLVELHGTLERMGRRERAFGNGQPDAKGRSRPG